jgi:hypothetical protein
MIRAAVWAFSKYPPPLPSILCHALFISFPITSSLVKDLVAIIRDTKVSLCVHCLDESEQCASFFNNEPIVRSSFEREYFKSQHTEYPKITQLGEPNHILLKYDPQLLLATIINQNPPAPHVIHFNEPAKHVVWKDFFCGSHSREKLLLPIFAKKVLAKNKINPNLNFFFFFFFFFLLDQNSERVSRKSVA